MNRTNQKKALITGGTGYIGHNLVKKLLVQGWLVDLILRTSSCVENFQKNKNLSVYVYTGSTISMNQIVSASNPDVVFHLASMVVGEHKSEQIEDIITSNILFGTQLLDAMARNSVSCFVNTSTYWEHYENKDYSPVNLYAATKKAFRDIMQFYIEAKGLQAITLELFDPYGPDDPRPKIVNLLINAAMTGESFAMSPGEQKIDLIHIDDVVKAYEVAAERLFNGKVNGHNIYGIGTFSPLTLREIVATLEMKTGKKINVEWGERPYRSREVMEPWTDYDLLPGWQPEIKFKLVVESLFSSSCVNK